MRPILALSLWLTAATAGAVVAQTAPDSVTRVALVGVTLIDGTGRPARPNQTVLVEGERISAIFPVGARSLPSSVTVLRLTGKFVIPGLIDTHVHVATDPSKEDTRVRTERRRSLRARSGRSAAPDTG